MSKTRDKKVRICEVGPRDGLQNEVAILGLEDKLQFIKDLAGAGCQTIEATSFVRADRIPQMADAADLFRAIPEDLRRKVSLPCLVPNEKGLDMAISAGVTEIALFTATSDTFNKKNINATVEESLERLRPVAVKALNHGIRLRGYVSTVFGCPYEGETSLETLKKVSNRLLDFGVYEISFGDTIGVALPDQVEKVVVELKRHFDVDQLAMHFHDTWGMGCTNSMTAFGLGIGSFDSSAGGLGGCPYAKGATGNVATEDLVHMFEGQGISTGIDIQKLALASERVLQKLGRPSQSKAHQAQLAGKGGKCEEQ